MSKYSGCKLKFNFPSVVGVHRNVACPIIRDILGSSVFINLPSHQKSLSISLSVD